MGIIHVIQRAAGSRILLNRPLIKKSLVFAYNAHRNQKRHSGEDYIVHPLEVARILFRSHVTDEEVLTAALLHDVLEKTRVTLDQLEHEFGENIKNLVDGVTKLAKINYPKSHHLRQTDSIKKLLIAMSRDPRVMFIKLADRLHNMRTLAYMSDIKKEAIAQETLEIYGPMANMLGLLEWAWELEDLSFKFLNPEEYGKISRNFGGIGRNLSGCVNLLKRKLTRLTRGNIKFEIQSFKKHNYHIYRAQQRTDRGFDPIRDAGAIKITADTAADCYKLLGFVHSFYPPQPGEIKDYIAVPKINGYQGLHTVIFGPSGKMFHIQIRTKDMERRLSIPDGSKARDGKFIKNILSIYKLAKNPNDFIHRVKGDVFGNQIFVFSSKGQVISLPENSTCVDFAYAMHPNSGNFLKEAIVNGAIVQPCTKLKTGDIVKIVTNRSQPGPCIEWLPAVQTTKAQHYISSWNKFESRELVMEYGKEKLNKILCMLLGTTLDESRKEMGRLIDFKKSYGSLDELFEAIGKGTERPCEALIKIYPEEYLLKSGAQQKAARTHAGRKLRNKSVKLIITTDDTIGMLNRLAHCISMSGINIEGTESKTFSETKSAIIELVISVKNFRQLCSLIMDLEQIAGVRSIRKA